MDKEDFHSMEKLTHSIKGSSTTVGTGGVSDLLSEFNTYLKTGKDVPVAEVYFKHLNRYTDELEKQFA
jgi:chemotaxis protein histidine kinase CheA